MRYGLACVQQFAACLATNNIRGQCRGEYPATQPNEWISATIGEADELEITPDTQITVARPDKDDRLLRVFYQEKCESGSKSASLREVRYDYRYQKWAVQDNPIVRDALPGTWLSAVSDKVNKDVRLYYQGADSILREIFCHKGIWYPYCKLFVPNSLYAIYIFETC